MKQRSGSSSLSTLKLKSFTSLVARTVLHYNSHPNVTCLYVSRDLSERMHRFQKITGDVNEPKSNHPGTNHETRVFSRIEGGFTLLFKIILDLLSRR